MAINTKKPWPDVPRLLIFRKRISAGLEEGMASSVTAFLAWKAFLITAKSFGTGSERDRCVDRIATAIQADETSRIAAAGFASALDILGTQSNVAVAEWFAIDDDEDTERRDRIVAKFRLDLRKLSPRNAAGLLPAADRFVIAEYAFRLRNAVIAHGSVHSTGNLFGVLVPPFDRMICAVTHQGYAIRRGITVEEAEHECTER